MVGGRFWEIKYVHVVLDWGDMTTHGAHWVNVLCVHVGILRKCQLGVEREPTAFCIQGMLGI